jgi:hypothetical protein
MFSTGNVWVSIKVTHTYLRQSTPKFFPSSTATPKMGNLRTFSIAIVGKVAHLATKIFELPISYENNVQNFKCTVYNSIVGFTLLQNRTFCCP